MNILAKINFNSTEAYAKLRVLFENSNSKHLRAMFAEDAMRFEKFSVQLGDLLFDFSKNRIDESILGQLISLANELRLGEAREAMFTGKKINETENRSVLHTALRNFSDDALIVDEINIISDIKRVREKMKIFSGDIISGKLKGYSGQRFTDVVNIGIGGSDLGPNMVVEALKHYKVPHLQLHFVSNVDGTHIAETLKKLNPETTLFLIASKTFTTQETMANAHTARKWFLESATDQLHIKKHFVALSTAEKEVAAFGIDINNMFEFWDWVGGRYSLWSAIGLSVCLAVGYDHFEQLLKGGELADKHFKSAPFEKNIPVLMGLLGFWYTEFFEYKTHAVIPYDQYLHRFTAYLQQADMESNGKSTDRNGNKINYATGPVVWGEPGTNGQHAFFQLMHQGSQIIPADFIAAVHSLNNIGEHQLILLSNFLAQTEAMMNGKTIEEVKEELKQKGFSEQEINFHTPFRVFDGNRPTNTFLMNELTPFNLGTLIGLYEHKIFVQGIIWNIFSFDQWGVELGKKLAAEILPELRNEQIINSHDSSTNGLIAEIKRRRKG